MKDETELLLQILERFQSMPSRVGRVIAKHILANDRPVNGANGGNRIDNMVAAYIRHHMTGYDQSFHLGYTKELARAAVQQDVTHYLAVWR